jgi:hypothetical protein
MTNHILVVASVGLLSLILAVINYGRQLAHQNFMAVEKGQLIDVPELFLAAGVGATIFLFPFWSMIELKDSKRIHYVQFRRYDYEQIKRERRLTGLLKGIILNMKNLDEKDLEDIREIDFEELMPVIRQYSTASRLRR